MNLDIPPCEMSPAQQTRIIREMDDQLKALLTREALRDEVIRNMEERLLGRVDFALQQVDCKVNSTVAPMVQCLALEQMDLKKKVDSLNIEALNAQIDGVVQMVEALPEFANQAAAPAQLAISDVEGLNEELEDLRREYLGKLKLKGEADKDLRADLGEVQETAKLAQEDVERLKADVRRLEQQRGEMSVFTFGPEQPRFKYNLADPDARFGWPDMAGADSLPGINFSKKMLHGAKIGGSAAASFARCSVPLTLERSTGCRSLPHLPPVR